MATILSYKKDKRSRRWQKFKNWWFKLFALRKMRKRISKLYYKEQVKHDQPIKKLQVYAHAFKYDKDKIIRGLDMFIERGELESYEEIKKGDSKDAYILTFSVENRSQNRILAEIPEEIDLNLVEVETISPKLEDTASTNQQQENTTENSNKPF